MADFLEYVGCRATDFFPAGVRYYAEGAVFAAAFHDGNKGCGAVYARLGQTVELFNFRKRNVDLWLAGGTYCVNHFGQRSEEHTSELQSRPHLVCRLLLEKK